MRAHLEAEYGILVSKMSELDQGVFRVSAMLCAGWHHGLVRDDNVFLARGQLRLGGIGLAHACHTG